MSVDVRSGLRHALLRELVARLARTAVQHNLFVQAVAAQLGVAATDVDSLLLLNHDGPATAGELAESLGLTTGGVTGSVDRLASAGLVVRDADPSDRRRVIVRPTEQVGRLDELVAPVLASLARSLDALPDAALEQLIAFEWQAIGALEQATSRLRAEQAGQGAPASFSAALGQRREATLEFVSGAANVRIGAADAASADLYRATFEGVQPNLRAQGGTVSVRYKRMGPFEWRSARHAGSLRLHPAVAWRFAFHGGASDVSLDARRLDVADVQVDGGASKFDMWLPMPRGAVRLCFEGGQNRLHLQRPPGVPLQLRVQGGANRLEFDARRFGAVGGDVQLASPDWDLAEDRYIVEVRGGASRLTVSEVEEVSSDHAECHE